MDKLSQPKSSILTFVGISFGYFILACAALVFSFQHSNVSPIWLASGLGFIAIRIFGIRLWPAIWLGSFAANSVVFLIHHWASLPIILSVSFIIAVGNTLEAIGGCLLLNAWLGPHHVLDRVKNIFKFIISASICCAIAATIGSFSVSIAKELNQVLVWNLWFTWWLGDVVGILIVVPLVVTFYERKFKPVIWSFRTVFEGSLIFLSLITIEVLIFTGNFAPSISRPILPLIIWATYRFGYLGAMLAIIITWVLATMGTLQGQGPFVKDTLEASFWMMQSFMGITTLTALVLGGALFEREKTEERLRHNEERFRKLVENSSDMIILLNAEGKIFYISSPKKSVLGFEEEQYIGQSFLQWVHPEDLQQVRQKLEGVLQTPGATIQARCRLKHMDGHWLWVEGTGHNLFHEPTIEALVINYRDITEKKKWEETQLYLASIVENSEEAIFSKSLDGMITSWNRGAQKVYGYNPNEILGKSVKLLVPPEKHEEEDKIMDCIRRGEKIERRETKRRTKSGKVIDVSLIISPIVDISGTLIGASSIVQDITDRKKSQMALLESEERFRTMADYAPVMIWVSGVDGLGTFVNKAWLSFRGRNFSEEIGNGWTEGIHPEDRDRAYKIYLDSFNNRIPFSMDYRLHRFDGKYRWILANGVPRFNSDGSFVGYIGSCFDITELKNAEEVLKRDKESLENLVDERSKQLIKAQTELKHASRLADIGTLAATVAHELRNPLGVIQMAAYNLKKQKEGLKDDRHLLNIEKKVWEGNQIINNLLSYARIKIPFFESMNMPKLLDECISSSSSRFPNSKVVIERKFDSEFKEIEADPNHMREIFMNLLNNAYQAFSKEEGRITVEAHTFDNYAKISVEDTGSGIAPEDLEKVFEPFFTRRSKGTGLGLSICNELVNLHQGKINIESQLHKGTRITVTLPIKRVKI